MLLSELLHCGQNCGRGTRGCITQGGRTTITGPSVAPDDQAGIASWVLWLSLTGSEINVVLEPEGDRVWAMVCADVCTFSVNGDVTVDKVLVPWETELVTVDPLGNS